MLSAVSISVAQHNHSQCGTDIPVDYDKYTPIITNLNRSINCTGTNVTKYVNVNFHFMSSNTMQNFTANDDGQGNTNYTGYDRARDLVEEMNYYFQNNIKMTLPVINPGSTNNTPVNDINIQYVLKGVYFQQIANSYENEDINQWTINRDYGVNQVEEINISELSTGTYIIVLQTPTTVKSQKLVVLK